MYNILITGDRFWQEYPVIFEALTKVWNDVSLTKIPVPETAHRLVKYSPANILVIHGGARGADKLGGEAAFRLGMAIRVTPADWSKYKRGAGPVRNSLMLKENKVDLVLAFHDDLGNSKGTKDMVIKALEAGLPVRHYKSDGHFVELKQEVFESWQT
jgi:hypothetical protein